MTFMRFVSTWLTSLLLPSHLKTVHSLYSKSFLHSAKNVMTEFHSANPLNFQWQQTMLRIKDPQVSVPFYVNNLGFTLIHRYDFEKYKFSLYFLAILPENETCPLPGTPESEQYLWTLKYPCLELTHNHGTETDPNFQVNNGNVEPYRGFGHIAVMTPDVYEASLELETKHNVRFQKRPDEGRMKGIAFALDPDGYYIEIVARSKESPVHSKYTLAQTMFRVKDPVKSLRFYRDILGMTLLRETHIGVGSPGGFSLYFLAHIQHDPTAASLGPPPTDITSPDASEYIKRMFCPVIELTHNHGTENDPDFHYHNGNEEDSSKGMLRGFGHTGFIVDHLDQACQYLEGQGVSFKKMPEEGSMRGLAFVYDPDNYWVEIIQKGMKVTPSS